MPQAGYFVCSYLVLCNNLSPSEALEKFADARGHEIERPNYVSAVMRHHTNVELKRILENTERDEVRVPNRNSSNSRPFNVQQRHIDAAVNLFPSFAAGRSAANSQSVGRGQGSNDSSRNRGNHSGPRVGQNGNIIRINNEFQNRSRNHRNSRVRSRIDRHSPDRNQHHRAQHNSREHNNTSHNRNRNHRSQDSSRSRRDDFSIDPNVNGFGSNSRLPQQMRYFNSTQSHHSNGN